MLIKFAQSHEMLNDFIEEFSFSVCERCGESTTAKPREGGWIKTLCNKCHEERESGKVQD